YLDVDGDGIPYRTLPGTHPTRGAYFTRGTTRNPYAKYSEAGPDYVYNMERLLRKFDTAKALVPQPLERRASDAVRAEASPGRTRFGALHFGSTAPAMTEAHDALESAGIAIDAMRLRAFPFADVVK